jgi:hypothetical protein
VNNIFAGRFALGSTILSGNTGEQMTNLVEVNPSFVDPGNFDYHLQGDSDAIDAGTPPGLANDGTDLTPTLQYVDQAGTEDRPDDGTIDIGAYEYVASASPTVVVGAPGSLPSTGDHHPAPIQASHVDQGPLSLDTVGRSQVAGKDAGQAANRPNHLSLASPLPLADLVFASGNEWALL